MKNIKKMLSKVTEKTIAIFMAISLIANNFMPIMSVLAATFDETKDYNTYYQILNPNGSVNLNIDFENNNGGGNEPQTNKTATVNLTYTTGEYTYTAVDENGNESTKTDTYADGSDFDKEASIQVNGFRYEPNTTLNYNVEEGQTTATFNFSTLWHLKFYDSIIINGTPYNVSNYLDYDNQKAWLDHYDGQIVGFDIPNVLVANTYNITVKVGRQGKHHIANFLWTGDSRQSDRDNYIGNAHLEMIGLEYTVGGTKYTYTEDDFKSGSFDKDYVEYDSDESLKYDEGSLVVPAGSTITMRITPKYGYQVLSTNFAQSGITTTDNGVSEFTFTIGGGAAYFKADVVQVDDVVNAESEKVSSGSIELADGTLETGTARLTVSDVDLDSSKITDFEEAAGEYNIKSYLDIDLDNVWYRGTADSVWSEKKHELSDYATITLKLEDGVDGNDIVIVHNINDGDEFEVIQIDSYDPETNTITFRTKSFSNFAIASKTTATTETTTTDTTTTSNPQTGDNLRMYINLFILSAGGLAIATLQLKKRKLAKNK